MGTTLSLYEDRFELFDKELATIKDDYPKLHYRNTEDGLVLEGEISFDLTCKDKNVNERISDSYIVQIAFPNNYPDSPPIAKEIGGRIANNFHKNGKELCLDVPSKVYLIFKEDPTLRHFIKELLEPYLYSHSYWKEHNCKMPFGDRSHYGEGIIEHYEDLFGIKGKDVVLDFLELLADGCYKQSMPCPCGSKKKIRKCHGKQFLRIYNLVPIKIIRYELDQILKPRYGMK